MVIRGRAPESTPWGDELRVSKLQGMATTWGAFALFLSSWWLVRGFVADDTYIHLTYARHLRDGHGLVFNLGERIYGTTSPLWTVGLGVLGWTRLDLLGLAKLLSVASGWATVLLGSYVLHRLLSRWNARHGLDPRAAGLAWTMGSLGLAADVWLVRWSASGMESAFATFLVLGGFAAMIGSESRERAARAASWWWTLASLTRPEASLLLAMLVAWCLVQPGPLAAKRRALGGVLLPPLMLGGAWLATTAWYYGTIVPTTLTSKAVEGTPFLANLLLQARELAADRGVELAALVIAMPWLALRLRGEWREHLIPVGWLVALPLFYAFSGVPGITRYVLLLVPILWCYGWVAVAIAATRLPLGGASLRRAVVIGAGVAALGINGFVFARHVVPQARAFEHILDETLIPTAKWFAAHTPPETQVAIPHVGVFGYHSGRKVVDLGGLVTPGIGATLARYTYERMVLEFRFAEHARPDYLVDVDTESRRLLRQSPYAPCLTLIEERPYDYRSLLNPGPAFLTVYRVDWECYEARGRVE
jgi:hypothetical protein